MTDINDERDYAEEQYNRHILDDEQDPESTRIVNTATGETLGQVRPGYSVGKNELPSKGVTNRFRGSEWTLDILRVKVKSLFRQVAAEEVMTRDEVAHDFALDFLEGRDLLPEFVAWVEEQANPSPPQEP